MAKKYSTAFALTEDPLDESGVWGAPTNVTLTRMESASGHAIAKALGVGAYDDSAAHLSGYGADYELTATLYKDPTLTNTATHECELLLRINDTATVTAQYEMLYSFDGNTRCVRWFSNGGTQDFDFLTPIFGDEEIAGEFVSGDRIRARACNQFLILSVIIGGVEDFLGVYSNTVLTSGQPGIGGFTRVADGGDASKFAFDDAQISDIFIDEDLVTDDFNRANESPLSGGGNWSTATGMNALRLVSNEVATVTADSDSGMRYTGVSAGIDHYSEITISNIGASDFGCAVCMMANGDCYLTTGFNGVELFIFSRIGGSFNQLGVVTAVYAASDVIRLERFGAALRLYKNGTLILTVTAEVDLVGGTFGIFGYDGTFRITSFTGGKLVADYDAVPGSGGTVYTQTLTDSIFPTDGTVASLLRGRVHGDVTTVADFSAQAMLRGVTASDVVTLSDDLRLHLVRNRLAEDGYVILDSLISELTASQIFSIIATSLAEIGDESFLFLLRSLSASDLFSIADSALAYAERNAIGTDEISINEEGQFFINWNRTLESPVEFNSEQFNFKQLVRILESSINAPDNAIAQFVDGEAAVVDGSKIQIGFVRPSIVLGVANRIKIS